MCIALEHLFDYDDFRKFLQDYFEEQKKMRSVFSHRFFAAKAGFSSSSYCLNVIRGRFNLTPKSIEKISKAMEFEPLQKTYFEVLVQYNQAQQVAEREHAWNQIVQIRKQIEFTHVTTREQGYFEKWYYPIVRELAVSSDWDGDYRVLARSVVPQITTDEARDAVKKLLEWGLLKKEGEHYVEKSYNYAVKVLEDARKKTIARAANDSEVERVYEMMLVAFPMSKKIGKEAEDEK